MDNFLISFIRTAVPAGVAVLTTWLATEFGLIIDEQTSAQTAAGVTGLVLAGYYVAARAAESRWPAAGWLLGQPSAPTYQERREDE